MIMIYFKICQCK